MKNNLLIRMLAFLMIFVLSFSFSACSREGTGDMSDKSETSKGDTNNSVPKSDDAVLTRGYYNWIYADAFKDFEKAVDVTSFSKSVTDVIGTDLDAKKKVTVLRNIFSSEEMISAIQTASELESSKKYTHNVITAKRLSKGVYNIKMQFKAGDKTYTENYELKLHTSKRAVSLTNFSEDGKIINIHEILVTNNGYTAINRISSSNGTWVSYQYLFKGGNSPEGYCEFRTKLKEMPQKIYPDVVYNGFAGKNS